MEMQVDEQIRNILMDIIRLAGRSEKVGTSCALKWCNWLQDWKELVKHELRYRVDERVTLYIEFEVNKRDDKHTPQIHTFIFSLYRDRVTPTLTFVLMVDHALIALINPSSVEDKEGELVGKLDDLCMQLEGVSFSAVLRGD